MSEPQESFSSDEIYKKFIANSKLHIWALNDGARLFVRCVVNAGEPHTGADWPRVYAENESRVVNCAIFVQNEDTTFQLIAVWARSLVDDSTKIYTKAAYEEAVLMVLEITGGGEHGAAGQNQLVDRDCYDAFLNSAGHAVLEDFSSCSSLVTASPVEVVAKDSALSGETAEATSNTSAADDVSK